MSVRLGHQAQRSFVISLRRFSAFKFIAQVNDLNNQTKTIKSSSTSLSFYLQIISMSSAFSVRLKFIFRNLKNKYFKIILSISGFSIPFVYSSISSFQIQFVYVLKFSHSVALIRKSFISIFETISVLHFSNRFVISFFKLSKVGHSMLCVFVLPSCA